MYKVSVCFSTESRFSERSLIAFYLKVQHSETMDALKFLRKIKSEHDEIWWYTFPVSFLIFVFQPEHSVALSLFFIAAYSALVMIVILPRVWFNPLMEKPRRKQTLVERR